MTVLLDPDRRVLDAVARLHVEVLPGSRISRLGLPFARSFYAFAARSNLEHVLALSEDGEVRGAALLSLSPKTLTRRSALRTTLAWALLRHPSNLLAALAGGEGETPDIADLPEIVAIFVAAGRQSAGEGTLLLRHAEKLLREAGFPAYLVRTENRVDNRAISFYERNGFRVVGASGAKPAPFLYMKKSLD
ncbi:GNAT family N-acetyltransferase [Rhizobium sp. RU36D]|uniref:GNAT family N-acetyltransferase n=1 Tax=Rhizobium sp. RU36D TaxID=1907415 RepID=UPI0009D7E573|nr:GNAT family N-acetyltransferase [Rhizobium sp. RU36D]SMD15924.1 Acetyltransferase (GNAT) family protein [Rhizobium sp. RU36D]